MLVHHHNPDDETSDTSIKIADFGIGRRNAQISTTAVGTEIYRAPETLQQVASQGYDGRKADMWSIGVVLYAVLKVGFPFQDTDAPPAKRSKVEDFIANPNAASKSCRDFIGRLLEIDPNSRPSAEEALADPFCAT